VDFDGATLSALLVVVPEAEQALASHRLRLDPSAARGVPAHVTVLFPFAPPGNLSDEVLERAASVVATVESFDCAFSRTAWFGEDVLWLEPEAVAPFTRLLDAVANAFPEYPRYGGAFEEAIPHLTIGDRRGGATTASLRAAESDVTPLLPVRSRIDSVLLMTGGDGPGSWHTLTSFPLA
jgi:2'-5' RNA ligase